MWEYIQLLGKLPVTMAMASELIEMLALLALVVVNRVQKEQMTASPALILAEGTVTA